MILRQAKKMVSPRIYNVILHFLAADFFSLISTPRQMTHELVLHYSGHGPMICSKT
jgi:hypothetical protein